jgi:hypothetical protein
VVDLQPSTRARIQMRQRFAGCNSLDHRMRGRFAAYNTVDFLDARASCSLNPESTQAFRSISTVSVVSIPALWPCRSRHPPGCHARRGLVPAVQAVMYAG